MWWALTDQRFLAWSGRFKPKRLECAVSLDQLTGIVTDEQKMTWGVGLSFADGSHRRVEAPLSGNDVASLAGAAAAAGLVAG